MSKKRWLIIGVVMVLVPILLGTTPLNFVHKLGSGCPFSQKQVQKCNFNPFHSLISQNDYSIGIPSFTLLDQELTLPLYSLKMNSESVPSHPSSELTPLRC